MRTFQVSAGRAGVSTVHEQQSKAIERIREHVQEHGLEQESSNRPVF